MDVYYRLYLRYFWIFVAFFFISLLNNDELLEQEVKFKNYLLENGWKGSFGIKEDVTRTNSNAGDDRMVIQNY